MVSATEVNKYVKEFCHDLDRIINVESCLADKKEHSPNSWEKGRTAVVRSRKNRNVWVMCPNYGILLFSPRQKRVLTDITNGVVRYYRRDGTTDDDFWEIVPRFEVLSIWLRVIHALPDKDIKIEICEALDLPLKEEVEK